MGLSSKDSIPEGISLKDAYGKVMKWYSENIALMYAKLGQRPYCKNSENLIRNFPNINKASNLEMKAVLCEIFCGNLEWGYHESDGEYKMAAYAVASIDPPKQFVILDDAEKNSLTNSKIWPFLMFNSK